MAMRSSLASTFSVTTFSLGYLSPPWYAATALPDGKAVSYGIRPGDMSLAPAGQGVAARVIVVEPTGAETELLLDVGGTRVILVMHGRTDVRPDDEVSLQVDANKSHLFDQASGQRLV